MFQSVVLILLIPAVNKVEGGGRGETLSSEETDRVYSPVQWRTLTGGCALLCLAPPSLMRGGVIWPGGERAAGLL